MPRAKQKSSSPWLKKFLLNFSFGADGPATYQNDCEPNGVAVDADVSSNLDHAAVSYNYDGATKKKTLTIKGAVGHDWPIWDGVLGDFRPYVRADFVSNSTGGAAMPTAPPNYSSRVYEVGAIYRWPSKKAADGPRPAFYTYVQPLYSKDLLRHSELYGVNIRWTPLHRCLNQYCTALAKTGSSSRGYGGFILDGRIDAVHFSIPGVSLAAPTSPTKGSGPSYLPNQDYVRIGGRAGAFFKLVSPWWYEKDVTVSAYYLNFGSLHGVTHDFGETVAQVSFPIAQGISLSLSYTNGRTENIAQRQETFGFGVSLGGHG